MWFADFISVKRLTLKGVYGASLVLQFPFQSFFSVLWFTSVLLNIKLIWSLDCNSMSFSGKKCENSRVQNSRKRLSCLANMTFSNLFNYLMFFKAKKRRPLFFHCIPREAGVTQRWHPWLPALCVWGSSPGSNPYSERFFCGSFIFQHF